MKDHRGGLLDSSGRAVTHFRPRLNGSDLISWPNPKEAGNWSLLVCPERGNGIGEHPGRPSLPQVLNQARSFIILCKSSGNTLI